MNLSAFSLQDMTYMRLEETEVVYVEFPSHAL